MSSATALANAGVKAVSSGKYAEGIQKLTEALEDRPAPLWYLERSKAYVRTNEFDLALDDAEMALRLAFDRANRDQMMEAQLRRSITLFRMGRFADADVCAFWAIRLSDGARAMEQDGQLSKVDENGDYTPRAKQIQDESKPNVADGLATAMNAALARSKTTSLHNQAFAWRIQALTQMENLPVGHDGRKIHLSDKYPELSKISSAKKAQQVSSPLSHDGDDVEDNSPAITANATSGRDAWEKLWAQYRTMHTKHKIRCSFYQTETSLTVDVFLKNLSQEQITVSSGSSSIKLSPSQGVSLGGLASPILLLLPDEIKPDATKYNVKSMKIELVLQKQIPGKWRTLRRKNSDILDNLSLGPDPVVPFDQFFDFIAALGYKDIRELELPDFDSDSSAWYAALLGTLQSRTEGTQGVEFLSSKTEKTGPSSYTLTSQSNDTAAKIDSTEANTKATVKTSAPAYPTSSKTGPKNWDNIDDPDDDDAKDADVNEFFRGLYKGGDEDTRRAMMKSFIESNGTALSTSWTEAKGKTYETHAPDGAEAKKW